MTPKPVHPSQIKTPALNIGIPEGQGGSDPSEQMSWYEHRGRAGALEDKIRALEEEVALLRRQKLEWNTRAVEERARAERAEATLRRCRGEHPHPDEIPTLPQSAFNLERERKRP